MTDDADEERTTERGAGAAVTGAADDDEAVAESEDVTAESDAESESGSDAESEPEADAEPEPGAEPGTEQETEPDAEREAETERAADAEGQSAGSVPGPDVGADVPEDVAKYDRFQKMERAEYERVNEFLRDRTYVTAREWAIARLCADFRTETGVEMTKIGENLPRLIPFMTDTYTPQAVNQARASFEEKVRKAGATFLYGAMSGFFTAEDLDDVMYESTEIAKFLLEVEGADLAVEEELAAEDKISTVMRDVREASAEVRGEEVKCPECGHVHEP